MDLTTIAEVQKLYQPQRAMGTTLNGSFTQEITGVSRTFERYAAREMEWIARTEDFDCEEGIYSYPLKAWPKRTVAGAFTNITTVTVYNDIQNETSTYTQFGASTALDPSCYAVDSRLGMIRFQKTAPLQYGPRCLRVTYTGGLHSSVTSAAEVILKFPELALAAGREIVRYIQSSQNPEMASLQTAGGSMLFIPPSDFLETTRSLLRSFRRTHLG